MRLPTLALLAIGTASAFHFSGAPLTIKMPSASAAAHHAQSGASAAAHRAQYPPRARHLLMAGSAEDDGIVLVTAFDAVAQRGLLVWLDAKDMTPLGRAYAPVPTHMAFHGVFVPK